MDKLMDELDEYQKNWLNEWIDGWMNGSVNESECVYLYIRMHLGASICIDFCFVCQAVWMQPPWLIA